MKLQANHISVDRTEIVIVDPSLGLLSTAGPLLIGLVGVTIIAAIIAPEAFGQIPLLEVICLAALLFVLGMPHVDVRSRKFLSTPKSAFVANKSFIMAPDDSISLRLWDWPERIVWSDVRSMDMEHRPMLSTRLRPFLNQLVLYLKDGRTKRLPVPWITGQELGSVVAVLSQIAQLHGLAARLAGRS